MSKRQTPAASGPLRQLWDQMPPNKRLGLAGLLGFMVFAAVLEVVSLGALLPFLVALFNPQKIWDSAPARQALGAVGIVPGAPLEALLAAAFIGVALVAGAVRLVLLNVSTRYAFSLGSYLANRIFSGLLGQDYVKVIAFDSSEIISAISVKINNVIYMVVLPILTAATAAVMIVGIAATIFVVDARLASWMFGGFGVLYYAVLRHTRKKLFENGKLVSSSDTRIVKLIQEAMGGIKDIVLSRSRQRYCELYRDTDARLRRAQGDNAIIGTAPRFFIETAAMVGIAGLAYYMVTSSGSKELAFSLLGVVALAAQRLLPLMQQAYLGISTLRGGGEALRDVLALLERCDGAGAGAEEAGAAALPFEREIRLRGVGFRYPASERPILQGVDLVIRKGERIGFVGPSGGGKSTLLDVVMGLLQPGQGTLEIDGTVVTRANVAAWRASVAHVPQSIFLVDASVADNVRFCSGRAGDGAEDVLAVLRQAQIHDDVQRLPEAHATRVGERGASLSGGQRQRLGIARALYRGAPLLVLDEATSALDGDTEARVMRALDAMGGGVTVLMIAHRVETLRNCDRIVELRDGRVVRIGSYEQFYGQAAS